jgi:3-isopropylmalate dehydrogenase
MSKHILILAGDGIGPEIVGAAEQVLTKVNQKFNLGLTWEHGLLGGAAIDAHGEPYPAVTSEQAKKPMPFYWVRLVVLNGIPLNVRFVQNVVCLKFVAN